MLSFKEFQKEAARTADKRLYLSLEQQKECYKWYLRGARELMEQVLCKAEHFCGSKEDCLVGVCCPEEFIRNFIDDMEKELKNAETEEN